MPVITIRPDGNVLVALFPIPEARANWDCVDEDPADDTDFVYNNPLTADLDDLYSTPASGVPVGATINSVKVFWRAWKLGAGIGAAAGKPRVRALAEAVTEGAVLSLSNVWFLRSQTWLVNPVTGLAWTVAEANDLDIGVGLSSTSVNWEPECSQVYAEIDYTPAAGAAVLRRLRVGVGL